MILKKLHLLLIFFFCLNLYSQKINNGIVKYKVSLQLKKEKLDSIKKVNPFIYKLISNQEDKIYVLKFDDVLSTSYLEKKMKNESNLSIDILGILLDSDSNFFSDKKINTIQKEFSEKTYIISEKTLKWELKNEKKKIGNYVAYRAISVQNFESNKGPETKIIEAWYTPEISVNFGPKLYSGLPGLILELNEDNTIQFKVLKIGLNLKDKFDIELPKKGESISRQNFNKLIKKSLPKF